jgi:thiosulfate/3-mercaptopyruvate sulfurtransferase
MTAHIALVSPIELQQSLHRDALSCILDARSHSEYVAGHIPGAVWMSWEEWCEKAPPHAGRTLAQAGYWGVLNERMVRSLPESLDQVGLREERPVVVYADGPISKGREGRIAWMLLYWGLSPVFLLNGGWQAWLEEGGSSDVTPSTLKRGLFPIRLQEQRRIQLPQLRQDVQRKTMPLLIDVRSRAEFTGQRNAYQPRMGRLPGAVHMPFTDVFDEAGYFVTKNVYLQRLPSPIQNADRCVAYCEVGVRSALFALLHEVYTGQVVANFDGSVMEWALDRTLPMEDGAE